VLVFGFFPFENGWNWQGFEFGSGSSMFGTLGVPVMCLCLFLQENLHQPVVFEKNV
jgi:hypothetical protein